MRNSYLAVVIVLFVGVHCSSAVAASKEKELNPLAALMVALIFDYTELEALTGGFVVRSSEGICAVQKLFTRNGKELRLQGMAHIGGKEFYQEIKEVLKNEQAVMLMEGVTDEKKLLATPPDYDSVAGHLGLASQRDHFSPENMPETLEIIRADLDTSDFSPQTIEILNFIGKVYSKEGINPGNLLLMYMKLSDVKVSRAFLSDLITRRNQCLIGHILENLPRTSIIVVPWGAMHLPQIEKWAIKEGFVLSRTSKHVVMRFPDMVKFILGPPKPSDKSESESTRTLMDLLGI
ncbi:MAG: hypothetical protein ACOYXC_05245 [Candidatus Rifleibacteriota bacterium]